MSVAFGIAGIWCGLAVGCFVVAIFVSEARHWRRQRRRPLGRVVEIEPCRVSRSGGGRRPR